MAIISMGCSACGATWTGFAFVAEGRWLRCPFCGEPGGHIGPAPTLAAPAAAPPTLAAGHLSEGGISQTNTSVLNQNAPIPAPAAPEGPTPTETDC
jgi:hypothetical protein